MVCQTLGLALLSLVTLQPAWALAPTGFSRREVLAGAGAGALSLAGGIGRAGPALAAPPTAPPAGAAQLARAELLAAIAARAPDDVILLAAESLAAFDPTRGKGAVDAGLGGAWRLLWTKDEAPPPVKAARKWLNQPASTQLLGAAAAGSFGEGRVAQLLDFPLGLVRFELSSGARPAADDQAVLEILPPFKFAAVAAGQRFELVNADSDADFRAVNARSDEAIRAPKNRFKQEYLETSGTPGDLRIGRIVEGDTAIVGSIYVYARI